MHNDELVSNTIGVLNPLLAPAVVVKYNLATSGRRAAFGRLSTRLIFPAVFSLDIIKSVI